MTMKNRHIKFIAFACIFVFLPHYAAAETIRYQDVAPIFNEQCILCHAGQAASNGFRMDTYRNLIQGGTNGAVIVPGNAENSELYKRIKGTSQPRMPLTGPPFLNDTQIELITQWINQGALDSISTGNQESKEVSSAAPVAQEIHSKPVNPDQLTYADIKPILMMRCVKCHSPNGIMGPAPENYLLDTYRNTMSANDRVRVVPGNAAASELVRRIRGQSLPRMPFDGPPYLIEEETQLVERWIDQGARDELGVKATIPTGAKIRLQGRLTERWNLDGNLPFRITGNTRLKKAPVPGDYVQLRGRLDSEGNIVTERLRRRD